MLVTGTMNHVVYNVSQRTLLAFVGTLTLRDRTWRVLENIFAVL
jgi:hypothetical protein